MKEKSNLTNSSNSVSCIITFCPELYYAVDNHLWRGRDENNYLIYSKVERIIINDLIESDLRYFIDGCQFYAKKYTFIPDQTLTIDDAELLDFTCIGDDDLWRYFFGQFVMNQELKSVWGFGITMVEFDVNYEN